MLGSKYLWHSLQGYRENNGLHVGSDADEQLLLYIPFNQVVKLQSLIIKVQQMKVYILSPTPFFLLQNPTFFMPTKLLVPEYIYIQILLNLTWQQEGMSAMFS